MRAPRGMIIQAADRFDTTVMLTPPANTLDSQKALSKLTIMFTSINISLFLDIH
jgi:hypothetical protein